MAASILSSSWVLAESFDAVACHSPRPIDFWEDEPDVCVITCPCCDGEGFLLALYGDCDVLQGCHRCHGEGEVLDLALPVLEDPASGVCPVCYGLEWIVEKGNNVWFRKVKQENPVLYALRFEVMDLSSRPCLTCHSQLEQAA